MAILTSCNFPVKKLDPFILDFELNTCERLKIIEVKPEIKFEYVGETKEINSDCLKELVEKHETSVFIMLPLNQALEIKRAYEAKNKSN